MHELLTIGWVIWLAVACGLLQGRGEVEAMVSLFPEGRRWWHFWAWIAAMAHFAAVVHFNPWA